MVGDDLRKLVLDILRVKGLSTKSSKHTSSKTARALVVVRADGGQRSVTYSSLPFFTKNRGLSGRQKRPTARMTAQSNWIAMGIRYDEVSVRVSVA